MRSLLDLPPWSAYRLLVSAGVLLGLLVSFLRGRRWGVPPLTVADGTLAAAVGGVVAGRVAYVAANWAYFQDHLVQAFQVWRGGLSAPAVLLGALGAVVLLSRWRGVDPRLLLDLLAPGAALVAGFAWLGCLWAGCAWGIEVRPDQGLLWHLSAELPDLYGLRAPRVAVQAMGAGWSGLAFLAALLAGRRGRSFPLWLLLHGAGGFGLGFLRGDLSPAWGGLSLPQMFDLATALAGLALLVLPGWRLERGKGDD
ncbi:MAG TPA: prolipoprotein diacylglyceryl transferase [Thermoflexia bacterium]|nr:prolipoprotein diacylglyceryl transferase [Thermoflexia bacterium]